MNAMDEFMGNFTLLAETTVELEADDSPVLTQIYNKSLPAIQSLESQFVDCFSRMKEELGESSTTHPKSLELRFTLHTEPGLEELLSSSSDTMMTHDSVSIVMRLTCYTRNGDIVRESIWGSPMEWE